MVCPETRELLDAYLDGELDLVRTLDVDRHLAGCPECARAFDGMRALQAALRAAPLRHEPPPRLDARVRAALRREAAPRRRLALAALAGAAAATLVLAAAAVWVRPAAAEPLAREVAAANARSLMAAHLTDVRSTDRHTVKPWFAGRLDYAPPVPDTSGCGFPLAGGRLDYLDGRPVAALVYERGRHFINVFVWPAPDAGDSEPALLFRQGYSLIHWEKGGMTWWAASDLNPADLRFFVDHVRDQS